MSCYEYRFENKFASFKRKILMSVMIILIGISLLVALGFLIAYLWSVKDGQYKDDYTPSVRILFDDEIKTEKTIKTINKSNQ